MTGWDLEDLDHDVFSVRRLEFVSGRFWFMHLLRARSRTSKVTQRACRTGRFERLVCHPLLQQPEELLRVTNC